MLKIRDTIANLRSGELDLLHYLTSLCARIEAEEHKVHALIPRTFYRTRVLQEASDLLSRYPNPDSRPVLFGIPVGIKDIFRVAGFPTRAGSSLPPELFEGQEATSVSRLKGAGVIVMGKTVTTEFAWLEPGPTRNPHRLEHTPGGSSSGSAAGVACGFFPFALGTQTAGSITRPAAYCGVVGFKPSFGRISTAGVIPFSPSADHVGIFCPDPSGIDLFMMALAEDWQPLGNRTSKPSVLGVPEGLYFAQASHNAQQHFEAQLTKLLHAGYEVKRIRTLEEIGTVNEQHRRMIAGEMARVHSSWFKEHGYLYRPKTAQTIEQGLTVSDQELERLRSGRLRFREGLERQMESEGIAFWVCPSTTDHAPKGLESTGSPVMNLPWTYAGLPTLSLPSGLDPAGLPLGIQVVGRYLRDEDLVVGAMELFEALSDQEDPERAQEESAGT